MTQQAKLTQGSTLRHLVVMSFTSALGLMCMFMVDLVDMLFLSFLDEKAALAAVGYASTVMFFTVSLCVATSIAATALVAKAIGEGQLEKAKRRAVNVFVFGILLSSLLLCLLWPNVPQLLTFLGASGRSLALASNYLHILILGMPAVMVSMISSGIMRALGDARRAMYATLIGGLINALLDPIFIFVLGLGVEGAALASLLARLSMVLVSYYGVVHVHKMLGRFNGWHFIQDVKPICIIALPAILTNMSSPLGNAIVMAHTATFGDDAVAAVAIIGRIIPVVFGGLFALSGALGPILAQNYGAGWFDRMHSAIANAVLYAFVYCLVLCTGLYLVQGWLVDIFHATQGTAQLIHFFATYVSFSFFFQSLLFIGIAVFNNLGKPFNATLLNFGRAIVGTWPLIIVFGWFLGAEGVLLGQAVGSVIFGCLGFILGKRYVVTLEKRNSREITTNTSIRYDDSLI